MFNTNETAHHFFGRLINCSCFDVSQYMNTAKSKDPPQVIILIKLSQELMRFMQIILVTWQVLGNRFQMKTKPCSNAICHY